MNVIGLFPTPFAYLELDIDPSTLKQLALDLEQEQPQGLRPGGWQSDFLDTSAEGLQQLTSAVENHSLDLVRNLWCVNQQLEPKITQAWCTINRDGGGLANTWSHLHPGAFLSFVYYAHAPQHSGDLVLEPAHTMLDYCVPENTLDELNFWNAQRHHYTPQAGTLVAFPGWIKHWAQPNQSGEPRISYALNVELATA